MSGKVWRTAAVVVFAPFVIVALLMFSTIGAALHGLLKIVFPAYRPAFADAEDIWVGIIALVVAGFVAAAATRLGRHSAVTGPFWMAVVLLVPLTAGLLYAEFDTQQWHRSHVIVDGIIVAGTSGPPVPYTSLVSGIFFWAGGLALAVIAAARLRRQGQRRLAWIAGVAGAVLVLDLAVIVPNLRLAIGLGDLSPLMWLPASLFGPASGQWNGGYSIYMVICSGYVLGYVIGAVQDLSATAARHPRPTPTTETDTEPTLQHV